MIRALVSKTSNVKLILYEQDNFIKMWLLLEQIFLGCLCVLAHSSDESQKPKSKHVIKAIYEAYLDHIQAGDDGSVQRDGNDDEDEEASSVLFLQKLLEDRLKQASQESDEGDVKQLFKHHDSQDPESYEKLIRSNQRMLGKIFSQDELDFLIKLAVHQQESEDGKQPQNSFDELENAFRQLIDVKEEEKAVEQVQQPQQQRPVEEVKVTQDHIEQYLRHLLVQQYFAQHLAQQQYYQQLQKIAQQQKAQQLNRYTPYGPFYQQPSYPYPYAYPSYNNFGYRAWVEKWNIFINSKKN